MVESSPETAPSPASHERPQRAEHWCASPNTFLRAVTVALWGGALFRLQEEETMLGNSELEHSITGKKTIAL